QNLLQRKPKQLSGGQRQRVALGRAIVREPQVFLMDEPLSNLDAKLRVQTRTEIIKLHQRIRTTTIYVTHDQVEAMTMGDRIAVLRDGVLQQLDSPQNLYDHPANTFVAGFIGSPAMNFFPVTVEADAGGMVVSNSAFKLAVPEQFQKRLERFRDKKVLFGIRPEDIEDSEYQSATRDHGQQVTVNVDVTEPLGAEVFLYLSSPDGENFVSRVDPRTKAKPGATHNVIFNLDKMHAFDPDTEEAIV
ncbi:MAG: ATP-binding cassette domain-containing protein, partial [Chloroflexi bacterium]|nr:ATP-binding cassette domain-containing protein [Chloroflexota bacterium]